MPEPRKREAPLQISGPGLPQLKARWRIAKGKMRDEGGNEISGAQFLAVLLDLAEYGDDYQDRLRRFNQDIRRFT